jgi:malate synthase
MEDAATAEISRAQVWQWIHHGARLSDGRNVTRELVRQVIACEHDKLKQSQGGGKLDLASRLFEGMMTGGDFPDFMTLVAYDYLD